MSPASVAKWPRPAAQIIAVLVSLAGGAVLFGWVLDLAWLKTVLPGLPKMSPLTASLFVLAGLALWIAARQNSNKPETHGGLKPLDPWLFFVLVTVVVASAALRLTFYALGWDPGIGLAMVYGVVQRHSADLEIESSVGNGSTIRLTFAAASPMETVAAQSDGPGKILSRKRVLVVDDDPLLLKTLTDILENDGHQVVAANGGQAGIDTFCAALAQHNPFAVVITDLGMPRVDGRTVASSVKAAAKSTPVILLTGWGQRLVAEGDIPPHVDRVLPKPPKLRDLREALAISISAGESPSRDISPLKNVSF